MGLLTTTKHRAKSIGLVAASLICMTAFVTGTTPAQATSINTDLDNFYSQVLDMIPEGVYGVRLGLGPAINPHFVGNSAVYVHVAPLISFRYKDLIAVDNNQIRINVLGTWGSVVGNSHWSAGPSIHIDPGRDDSDSPKLAGLNNVGVSMETGAYVAYRTGPVRFRAQIRQDIIDGHGGAIADFDVNSRLFATDHWSVSGNAQITYTNGTYNSSFYSIDAAQSLASGLPQYQAHGGLHDISANMIANYIINEHWSALGTFGLERLLGSAANNPLVEQRGSPNQVSIAAFAIYSF